MLRFALIGNPNCGKTTLFNILTGSTAHVGNWPGVTVDKKEGIYTVIRQDDYYKDTSRELQEAGSYEALFKTGFSFDTPDVIDLNLMKNHLVYIV